MPSHFIFQASGAEQAPQTPQIHCLNDMVWLQPLWGKPMFDGGRAHVLMVFLFALHSRSYVAPGRVSRAQQKFRLTRGLTTVVVSQTHVRSECADEQCMEGHIVVFGT